MEYEALKSIGLTNLDQIEKYSLRTEGDFDVLKVYYDRGKGHLIKKSEKFKFHRPKRTVKLDSSSNEYTEISEISPLLRNVLSELDELTDRERKESTIKEHILEDLRHLEKVVQNKIREIEEQLKHL